LATLRGKEVNGMEERGVLRRNKKGRGKDNEKAMRRPG